MDVPNRYQRSQLRFLNSKARRHQVSDETLHETATLQNLEADVYFEGDEIQLKLTEMPSRSCQGNNSLVFNMRYFDDDKVQRHVFEILETSEGALKASYHIAVKKIKTYLQ